MADLLYKTKGMVEPRYMLRVYFCCHPADFKRYFEQISDEILANQNCAIWYFAPGEKVQEEDLEQLSIMQLFVMPVTTKLLTTRNRALELEFPFAQEHHIPVLPLIQERGLDDLFNRKCGDLHFWDKTAKGSTVMSYDEKLKKHFLPKPYYGPHTFTACIFLSYRKKDRQYAQELMRLIHKNDFCWDVSIWYDEFLKPGENFDDAIETAIQKSQIFVMAVTPNMVNETNYVMTTEYHEAKKWGKVILPVQMVPTDETQLAKKFEGIPKCIDAHSEQELTDFLRDAFKRLNIQPVKPDPMHRFLTGVAYLEGMGVEVDRDRALQLITDAAESGLPEAIEKLVKMYRTGAGVQRDYKTAIQWQIKLIDAHRIAFEQRKTWLNYNSMCFAMSRLGSYFYELRDLPKAKDAYIRLQTLVEELLPWSGDKLAVWNRLICYDGLGIICEAECNLDTAKEYYQKSLELRKKIVEEAGDAEARSDLSVSYEYIGDICQKAYNLEEAREYYQKSLDLRMNLPEDSRTIDTQRDLARSNERLGDLCMTELQWNEARAYYQKSLDFRTKLAEIGMVEDQRNLSISYDKLGNICKAERKWKAARKYYQKSLELCTKRAEETGTVEARRGLSISYERLGDICKEKRQWKAARVYYQKYMELSRQLAKETGTVEARRDLAISYGNMGDICKEKRQWKAARVYYQKYMELSRQLAEETGTVEARQGLSICYDRMGSVCKAERKWNAAREYYQKGLELCTKLVEETGTTEARWKLSISYHQLGSLCKAEHNWNSAREYYQKAIDLRTKLAEETDSLELLRNLMWSYSRLGDVCLLSGNWQGATEYYQKSNKLFSDWRKKRAQ